MTTPTLERQFAEARRDGALAVLEGFHAVKHALRFGATFTALVVSDAAAVDRLAQRLAPDIADRLRQAAHRVDAARFAALAPDRIDTGVIAIARRRDATFEEMAALPGAAPIVALFAPSHAGNIGAAIRVSAAAGAEGLIGTGQHDLWSAGAIRGSAGLHYALPLLHSEEVPRLDRPRIAVTPEGAPLAPGAIPDNALLIFGSERRGLPDDVVAGADTTIRIPMRPGVSSLNLATAVAVALYAWRLGPRASQ